MTPVILLSDGYIANGSEPWQHSRCRNRCQPIEVRHPPAAVNGDVFMPYARDERLARPWAIPGTPGLMHRIGGLEKQDITGNVSYEPDNHRAHGQSAGGASRRHRPRHCRRKRSTARQQGKLLVLSWGGTYGACATAVREVRRRGRLGGPRPSALSESVAGEPGRDLQALRTSADSGTEPGPIAAADPRRCFWSTPSG